MVRAASDTPVLFDFFAQSPKVKQPHAGDFREIHADFGEATQSFHIGSGSTATPGLIPGLFHLHEAQASLPMARLLAPAIAAARDGVVVTTYQHRLSTIVAPILVASTHARALFAPQGSLIAAGETFKNPGLGELFALLAEAGLSGYFEHVVPEILGSLGEAGHLEAGDFGSYRVVRRAPLELSVNGLRAWLNPLPSAGGTLIAHTIEAMNDLSSIELARSLDLTDRERADAASALSMTLRDAGQRSYRGTTHISVVDGKANACSLTVSNGEGNGEIAGRFGFMPNNMLGESDVNPDGALGWLEDRRLSSMMCPLVAQDGHGSTIVLGSGGSNRIRSALAAVLCRLADGETDLKRAIDAPRLHVEGGHLDVESQLGEAKLSELKTAFADHRVWIKPNMFFGGCHAVSRRADGSLSGAGDARRDGVAITL